MKKITLLSLFSLALFGFSQTKTTGVVTLSNNVSAVLSLNSTTSVATLALTGPNDRWFALQFGSFADGDGMLAGEDVVYWNNVTLVDAKHNGGGIAPTNDPINNWVLVSNTDNSPSLGLRTVIFSRPFATGDANDYTFNYADSTIDFAWAKRSSAGYTLNNHGTANRGYAIDTPLTVLGTEDFSLQATSVYPNPSKGEITIAAKTEVKKVNFYSITGALVKSVTIENNDNNNNYSIKNIEKGTYLIEIQNDTEKTWKKLLVE